VASGGPGVCSTRSDGADHPERCRIWFIKKSNNWLPVTHSTTQLESGRRRKRLSKLAGNPEARGWESNEFAINEKSPGWKLEILGVPDGGFPAWIRTTNLTGFLNLTTY
jgi:hypothetical protein